MKRSDYMSEMPLQLQKLIALRRRTPIFHPKLPQIKEDLAKRLAGHRGEMNISYYLSLLPEKAYYKMHNLRLCVDKHFFQIDHLLFSSHFSMILETKHIAGILEFDEQNHQLIRTLDTKKEAFSDPLIQVYFQKHHFQKWLTNHGYHNLPIYTLVVSSNPSSILQAKSPSVIRSEFLPIKIQQIETKNSSEKITEQQCKKLLRLLKKENTPLNKSILEQYEITKNDLIKGVHCPTCEQIPIERIYGCWRCPTCHEKYKDAHLPSIKDYALLISETFSNLDIQEFFQIKNPYLINRLLHSPEIILKGNTKATYYTFRN